MVETANLSDRNLKSLLRVQSVGVPLVSLSARSSYAIIQLVFRARSSYTTIQLVFQAKQRATRPPKKTNKKTNKPEPL